MKINEIVAELNKMAFKMQDFNNGIHCIRNDLLAQISQQPIRFTVAGFYQIDKTFVASVRNYFSDVPKTINILSQQTITGVITYQVILIQLYK